MRLSFPDVAVKIVQKHEILRRLVGAVDGRTKAGAREVKLFCALAFNAPFNPKERQALMARLIAALARLDDHWIGDLIGAVCLFGMLWGGLFLGFAVGFK